MTTRVQQFCNSVVTAPRDAISVCMPSCVSWSVAVSVYVPGPRPAPAQHSIAAHCRTQHSIPEPSRESLLGQSLLQALLTYTLAARTGHNSGGATHPIALDL